MWKALGLAVALIVGFALFYADARTPDPVAADAPADAFSAARAMADVRAIGSTPHPVGSPANARVRDYLAARMTALGLKPQVQRAVSFTNYGTTVVGGTVENVIGVLRGSNPALPAVAVMAHHDSVPGSPGAADDTAGVAAALEMVRALKAGGVPARDVMVVITDGEESGLLGARAFVDQSPLAAHVGYVINMDVRGGGGRAIMSETGPGNGGDIALYRATAFRPYSNALSVLVAKFMPNSTDFQVTKAKGLPGLNYAFIGRQFDYHSPSSTPAVLDQGSLQHMGAQVLPTLRALSQAKTLPARAPDEAYGNLIGGLVGAYPTWGGWIVLALAAGMIWLTVMNGRKDETFAWADAARGAGASLYLLGVGAALLLLVRRATGVEPGWISYRVILAHFPLFEAGMLLAVLGAALFTAAATAKGGLRRAAVGLAVFAGLAPSAFGHIEVVGLILAVHGAVIGALTFGKPTKLPGAWSGVLITALVAGVAAQIAAPTAAFVIGWPLLAAAMSASLTRGGADPRRVAIAVQFLIAALVLSWSGGLFHALLQALDIPEVAILPAWLAALSLWPLATWASEPAKVRLIPAGVVIVLALAIGLAFHIIPSWSPRHPNAVQPVYVMDPTAGRAWRMSVLTPDAWSLGVLKADGGAVSHLPAQLWQDLAPGAAAPGPAAAPAHPIAATPPAVSVTHNADGTVTVKAAFAPGAERLRLGLRSSVAVTDVSLEGRPAPLLEHPGKWSDIRWTAPDGFTLTFRPKGPGTLDLTYTEGFDHWPADAKPLPPLPANDMAWDTGGSTLVVGRQTVNW